MIWFQIFAILGLVALVGFFVVNRGTARASAGVKLLFVAFIGFGLYAMLRQDDVTWVANKIGIQRGLDLVLFLLVIAFAFTTVSTYLRFRDLEVKYARLARAIALQDAERENHSGTGD
ncbi:DUF2304 domain-containing protein [Gordonia hongkongensis]|uniref:DUF2304 domain-containing protein n=1 Tax=Gordonia hongkongensis TaxID=1701090 RepID=A0AAX3T8D1_9ACTN|nr:MULTISPECIES: DUF2304 domain-containing protein [Gordonia]QIK49619.1 DUF2304 domain-containing protein [Gordonia terrae]MDF6102160.1 DUF2304 domain-containing protein [Gordonia hongkongensis]OCH81545.1 hypothetical protein A9310_16955 [Gordonia sp. UCD-TK1]WFP25453.1 DUF2304 domain-containing protein [Gordonia hongkongensis]WGJ86142.1 DUF2304 domain-containing protein [Gordonia sp. SMJS1]